MVTRIERAIRRARTDLIGHLRGETVMLALAAIVGLGTGLLAVALIGTLRGVQRLVFPAEPHAFAILLVPAAGALLVGLFVRYLAPETGGSGIVQVLSTIALRGGRFPARTSGAVIVASGLALGTGASGGREGPIVLAGGSFGSLVGRLFGVDADQMRSLVAAGAAAGIGASFNAPIGGMLFAIELVLREFRVRSLQVVVVSSVVAAVTAREIVGPGLAFFQPARSYRFGDPRELLLYAALGFLAVGIGVAFIKGEQFAAALFDRLALPKPLTIALGGLGVGAVALLVPEVLGTGDRLPPINGVRDPVRAMLDSGFGVGWAAVIALVVLAVAKLVATSLAVGSGHAVGTFAPVLFMGAATGGAMGHLAATLLPDANVQPGAFALVGMAAAFSATGRAPLTAILIVFELTGDYGLVLPLMFAAGTATYVADRVHPESLYGWALRKQGIVYAEPRDIDIMQTVTVGEIMTRDPDVVPPHLSLPLLRAEFERTRHHGFPVVEDGDRLFGVVTLADLTDGERRVAAGTEPLPRFTADICSRRPVTVTPGDPVFRGLRRLAALDVGRLPVVASDDHGRLVGLLRRSDVVKAYQRAVTRSQGVQHRQETSRLRDLLDAHFVELAVSPGAPAAGREVRQVEWPRKTVLTSIRRRGELILPHGDTLLEPGDEVVVITDRDAADEVRRLLAGERPAGAAGGA